MEEIVKSVLQGNFGVFTIGKGKSFEYFKQLFIGEFHLNLNVRTIIVLGNNLKGYKCVRPNRDNELQKIGEMILKPIGNSRIKLPGAVIIYLLSDDVRFTRGHFGNFPGTLPESNTFYNLSTYHKVLPTELCRNFAEEATPYFICQMFVELEVEESN